MTLQAIRRLDVTFGTERDPSPMITSDAVNSIAAPTRVAGRYIVVDQGSCLQRAVPNLGAGPVFAGAGDCPLIIIKDGLSIPSANAATLTLAVQVAGIMSREYVDPVFMASGYEQIHSEPPQSKDVRLEPLLQKLITIETGEWAAERGTQPSGPAIRSAQNVILALKGGPILPQRVLGGDERIILYFRGKDRRYVNLEFFNSGEMFVVKSNGHGTLHVGAFDLLHLPSVLDDVSAYVA